VGRRKEGRYEASEEGDGKRGIEPNQAFRTSKKRKLLKEYGRIIILGKLTGEERGNPTFALKKRRKSTGIAGIEGAVKLHDKG